MEADWEVEIGPRAPMIDACWEGLIDLRREPAMARTLPEVTALPELQDALVQLNAAQSPVWTAKCDVWQVADGAELDADEIDASADDILYTWSCYIDLLPKSARQWSTPQMAVVWCERVCSRLHTAELRSCRVDLIVRSAMVTPDLMDRGITAYLTACGLTEEACRQVLGDALIRFVAAICADPTLE